MVPKVAVIALVVIVACPILLGYGFNLTQDTETGYKASEESTNITSWLENGYVGSAYTFAQGDINKMNTDFNTQIPIFKTTNTVKSSYNLTRSVYSNQSWTNATQGGVNLPYFYEEFDYDPTLTSVTVQVYASYNAAGTDVRLISTINNCHSFFYENTRTVFYSTTYDLDGKIRNGPGNIPSGALFIHHLVLTSTGNPVNTVHVASYNSDRYANIADGYYFPSTPETNTGLWQGVLMPEYTNEYTFTMDLNSITDPNYTLHLNIGPRFATDVFREGYHVYPMELKKTTVGSEIKWTLRNENDSSSTATELFYDPSVNNTYQFTISADNYYDELTSKYYIDCKVKASYVGNWPTLIGKANSFTDYELDYILRDDANLISDDPFSITDLSYKNLVMHADGSVRSPLMRVDNAQFRAFEYKTITNRNFDAAAFKENPMVKVENIRQYGISVEFGGNVYTVSKGNINLEGRQIPLDGLEFISIPNEGGTYDNKIGNTLISTSAAPSTIKFNGSWVASVTMQSMEEYEYVTTEWNVGEFGWDGMDQNFLMVGLLVSFGAFIALGIYARRSRASIWPLMLVCGGAAVLFFIML